LRNGRFAGRTHGTAKKILNNLGSAQLRTSWFADGDIREDVLHLHAGGRKDNHPKCRHKIQLPMFEMKDANCGQRLTSWDIDSMSPLEAFENLAKLKQLFQRILRAPSSTKLRMKKSRDNSKSSHISP